MHVLTFSRHFPAYHPRAGEPTQFTEKIWNSIQLQCPSFYLKELNKGKEDIVIKMYPTEPLECHKQPKHHTIRAGHRFKAGDWFSPRVWGTDVNPKSGRSGPYQSKQIIIAPPIEVKKVWDIEIMISGRSMQILVPVRHNHWLMLPLGEVATNDGLSIDDFQSWMNVHPKRIKEGEVIFTGQIICWNQNINY